MTKRQKAKFSETQIAKKGGEYKCNYNMNLPRPSSSGKLGAWTRGTTETDDILPLVWNAKIPLLINNNNNG